MTSSSRSSIGDDEYYYAFEKIVIPVLKEYKPDIILISCGFDAAEGDPLGRMSLSPIGYTYMTKALKNICPKIIVALEGGYNLNSLSRCSEAIIRTLLNDPVPFKNLLLKPELNKLAENNFLNIQNLGNNFFAPSYYAIEQVNNYKTHFEQYWKSLKDIEVTIPKKKVISFELDNTNTVVAEVSKIFGEENAKEYMFNSQEEIEEITKNNLEYFKVKFGELTIPDEEVKNNQKKYLRQINIDNRTSTREVGWRLEGIKLDLSSHKGTFNEREFNWVKRDGIYDYLVGDVNYLLSKFLASKKIKKNDLLTELEKFATKYDNTFKDNDGLAHHDLFGVNLLVIPYTDVNISDSTVGKPKTKTRLKLKFDGFKSYSLTKGDGVNFINGLRNFIEYLKENLLE